MCSSRCNSRRDTAIGMLVCLGVVLLWFSPWWAGGRNLAPLDVLNQMMQPWRGTNEAITAKNHIVSDAVDQYLVYRMAAAGSYAKEGWLGWSTLTYGGTAQYANTMALYYDWTMQLHRWFDFWTAWHLGLMAQMMTAAAGMLLFLRGRSIGIVLAVCGALAFAGNSQFVTWIYHRWALGAFCWVPWILWSVDSYRRGNRAFWPLVPVFLALAFLGGTLQHGAYVILAVAAIWGEEAVETGRSFARQARLFGRHAAWGLLGVGLAGMMFIPCTDALLTTMRQGLHMGMHGHAEMGIYPKGPLQPLFNLAAYPLQIFPSVLGRSETVDVLKLFKSDLFYVAYFGSIPVLIGFLALARKQTPVLARFLIATGLLLPLTPLLRDLYQRLFLLFILGGILAFAHFMQNASAATKKRIFAITAALTGMAILAWTAASVAMKLNENALHAFLQRKIVAPSEGSSFGFFREWMQGRADKFMGDLFIWSPQQIIPLGLFLVALAGLRLSADLHARKRNLGIAMVCGAVLLEISVFGARWVTFVDPIRNPLFAVTPDVTALREKVGAGRVVAMIEDTGSHMAVTPFIPNTLGPYGIATIDGYDSIMPDGIFPVTNRARDTRTLGRAGVTHLMTYPENPAVPESWKSVWKSPSMELFENAVPVPRYAGFATDGDKDAFFTGADAPVVPLEETTRLENSRYIRTSPEVRWIRIAENAAAGWEYRIGKTAWKPVTRAPDASMLLDLGSSPGDDQGVSMRYDPPARKAGFMLSSVSLVLLLLSAIAVCRRPLSRLLSTAP